MATPNYSYEKRQRELAKKRKKEEKLKKRTERGDAPAEQGDESTNEAGAQPVPGGDTGPENTPAPPAAP